jgi:hypothetical protein
MRVRHKTPSIFSLSMVDVMCCALGCVILLWLINLRSARDNEETSAREAAETKKKADEALHQAEDKNADAARRLLDLNNRLDLTEKERQELEKNLKSQVILVGELNKELEGKKRRIKDLEGLVIAGTRREEDRDAQLKDLTGKLAAARKEAEDARKEAADALKLAAAAKKESGDFRKDSQAREAKADEKIAVLEDLLAKARDRAAKAEEKAAKLEKDVARLNDRATLAEEKAVQAEARFAGVPLEGENVVFIVDISGSMVYIDPDNKKPEKWPVVCATVAKLMSSLPKLKKFQVLIFSDEVRYLFPGTAGEWIAYDKKKSPGEVEAALLRTKVVGGTNLYAAVEGAFTFRSQGLDTVYLFSDGLPNEGEGVSRERADKLGSRRGKTLEQAQADEVRLGKELGDFLRNRLRTDWNPQKRVHINTVGFWYESPDCGAFLWALARDNDGNFVGMSKP